MRRNLWLPLLALLVAGCAPRTPVDEAQPVAVLPTLTALPASATPQPSPTATPQPSPTATPQPSPTAAPSATPQPSATATPVPSATPAVALAGALPFVNLAGIAHDYQRFNNCGPVSTSMALSYYNINLTQYDIAPIVKGAATDTNAAPYELSRYIQAQGLAAPVRVNGDLATLKLLLSNNIPVIVEQWLDRPDDELTAHYRLVRGYDAASGTILVNDSYTGPDRRYSEADFDRWWQAFHRVYLPVYPPDKEPLVRAIIGEAQWPDGVMWQQALARASAEVDNAPNLYAWYNLGEARLRLGDVEGAVAAFEQSLSYGWPTRFAWYVFAHLEAFNRAGRHERLLQVTQPYTASNVEEIHYQRGLALEALGRPAEALQEYQRAVQLNPRQAPQQEAVARLTP